MLEELSIENFRGFRRHIVPFRRFTTITGRNNAGKSTIVECLRLLIECERRFASVNYTDPPEWLPDAADFWRGFSLPLAELGFDGENTFHAYGDPPARISARFDDKSTATIYLGPGGENHVVLQTTDGWFVKSRGFAKDYDFPELKILPPLAPLARTESVLSKYYVRRNFQTHLAPAHFRNQLNLLDDSAFDRFRELVSQTWPEIQVVTLEGRGGAQGEPLNLVIRDGAFAGDAAWMGHGLQIWLQVMAFLARVGDAATVILDEPDVYLHPDLQRGLLSALRKRLGQTILASHSIEILGRISPEDILIVDRNRDRSAFATSLAGVQSVVDRLGGISNIQLSRLWNARRCLLVEGDDVALLRHLSANSTQTEQLFDKMPHFPIEGWDGWSHAVGTRLLLKNAGGQEIQVYCLLDRDYHTEEEVAARHRDAEHRGIKLHIWARKELENYLLVPTTIGRFIAGRSAGLAPTEEEVRTELDSIAAGMHDETYNSLFERYLALDRKRAAEANARAKARMDHLASTFEGRMTPIPGKRALSRISAWSQERYGVSISKLALAATMRPEELDPEVRGVLSRLERV